HLDLPEAVEGVHSPGRGIAEQIVANNDVERVRMVGCGGNETLVIKVDHPIALDPYVVDELAIIVPGRKPIHVSGSDLRLHCTVEEVIAEHMVIPEEDNVVGVTERSVVLEPLNLICLHQPVRPVYDDAHADIVDAVADNPVVAVMARGVN